MTLLQSFLLGAFQGLAEFLPISSSGHLLLFKAVMGLSSVPVLFDIVLHVATLFSILLVFRKRIAGILISIARWMRRRSTEDDAENLAIVVPALVATVLTAALGLVLDSLDLRAQPRVVAGLFLVTAAILVGTSFIKGTVGYRGMGIKHGIVIGLAQGIGVLPGISRSGITICAGLVSGMKREQAGEFAFLLAVPAVLGALILESGNLGQLSGSVDGLPLAVAASTAFGIGVLALLALMPLVRKGKLAWFAAYLIPVGIAGLFLF